MVDEPNYPLSSDPELDQLSTASYVGIHAIVCLGCFIVAAAITQVSRHAILQAALPLDPMSLRYLRFASAVADTPAIALLGVALVAAALDYAFLRALGRRSPITVVGRTVWSTLMTAIPFAALCWSLIALNMPFRGVAESQFQVLQRHREVQTHVRKQLIGKWVAANISNTGEPDPKPTRPLTIKFSPVEGTFPDLKAESSDPRILLSGAATVGYHGNGVCLHLNGGSEAKATQMCLLPKEPGDRMTLWAATPGTVPDDHQPTKRMTVLTLERKAQP